MILLFLAPAARLQAQDLDQALQLLLSGKYDECLELCQGQIEGNQRNEEWPLFYIQALLARGRYVDAETAASEALERFTGSIRLRLAGFHTAHASGNSHRAQPRLQAINQLAMTRGWAYRDPTNTVALGRAALLLGNDAKRVLENLFDPARRNAPDLRDGWIATAELALDKGDSALASQTLSEALKRFPSDPEMLYLLARAFAPGSRPEMLKLLDSVLEQNPNHVPSLVLLADHLVDAEEYDAAEELLERAFEVNPWHPEAWAYRAVLAHLRYDSESETEFRQKALHFWKTNPRVDHLIGLKLSQKYRFTEGAAYQRRALRSDFGYLPAKIQLAQDLLRLGEEEEGWRLAEQVHERDAYDVTAYNLATLRGVLRRFQTITNEHFILRMSPHEAALYGDRAMALLMRAQEELTEKYGIDLEKPTTVEIFPEQKDFAVRTLGVPHNPGFLGVCFGRLVTANSPASQGGSPANWEAVLWHEFAHVVTLQMTKNRIPRWLSEGISVYEELQANAAWGQTMNPQYREMILGGELTRVSDLSSAFMSPKSPMHIQFAYYQSALVVEFLIEQFGFGSLKAILGDLAEGVSINEAIARHTAPMDEIEEEFAAFAREKAEALGPELDWTRPEAASGRMPLLELIARDGPWRREPPSPDRPPGYGRERREISETPADAAGQHQNYWLLTEQARRLMSQRDWEAAKEPLQTLIELYPDQTGPNNAYAMLAAVHRGLNNPALEREALEAWAVRDADAPAAYLRLMELGDGQQDWAAVAENAERFLAVNPLVPQPYRFLARATENLGKGRPAIDAYKRLLFLEPPDLAEVHFRVAHLLKDKGDPSAKRHVLKALEEAPRFRDAHRLLLELAATEKSETNANEEASE